MIKMNSHQVVKRLVQSQMLVSDRVGIMAQISLAYNPLLF